VEMVKLDHIALIDARCRQKHGKSEESYHRALPSSHPPKNNTPATNVEWVG
jgi:hypothetical protein